MTQTITKVLDKLNTPNDLRKMEMSELYELSNEIRELIIKKVNTTGGHLELQLLCIMFSILRQIK